MALLCLIAMGDYPGGYDTSAHNHPTVVPDDSDDSEENEYADDPHGRYMRDLARAVDA